MINYLELLERIMQILIILVIKTWRNILLKQMDLLKLKYDVK